MIDKTPQFQSAARVSAGRPSLDLTKHPVLSPAQERMLTKRVALGDPLAKETLILHNMRLVYKIAAGHARRTKLLELEDLAAAGVEGLIRACGLFDPSKGFKFSTYAYNWISQAIQREIEIVDASIRLPTNRQQQLRDILKFQRRFVQEHHREPSETETADAMNIPIYELRSLTDTRHLRSLDAPLPDTEDLTLAAFVVDESQNVAEEVHDQLERDALSRALETLSAHQREVLRQRFEEKLSLGEIGKKLGLSRGEVVRVERAALKRLRTEHEALLSTDI